MKWDICFIVSNSLHKPVFTSHSVPVNETLEWDKLPIQAMLVDACATKNDTFYFNLVLEPILNESRGWIPWTRIPVSYTSFNLATAGVTDLYSRRSSTVTSSNCQLERSVLEGHGRIVITFESTSVMIPGEGISSTYELTAVVLHLTNDFIHRVIEMHASTKVVCLLQIMQRDSGKHMSLHNCYLGRAQQIETTLTMDRTHSWQPKIVQDGGFPGISTKTDTYWERLLEQHQEMLQLKVVSETLTSRVSRHAIYIPYMPDNDLYSNENRALPVSVKEHQMVSIKFYNLGMKQRVASGVDLTLKWTDFEHIALLKRSPRQRQLAELETRRLERQVSHDTRICVEYMWSTGNTEVLFVSIKLHVGNYMKTLEFNNLRNELKSI
jgi:hypothetical protein